MQRATYEGQQGYFDETTSEFHPKDTLEEATYEGKKGLFHPKTSKFFALTEETEPKERLGMFDRIANEAKRIAGWSEESITGKPSPGTPPPEPLPAWKKEELAKPVAFQPTPTPAPAPAFTPTDKFASYPVGPKPAPAPAPQASILPPLTEPPIAEPPKVAPVQVSTPQPTVPIAQSGPVVPSPVPEAPILPPLTEPPLTPQAPQPAPVAVQPPAPVIQPPAQPEAPPMPTEKRVVPVGRTRPATEEEIKNVTKTLPDLMPAHEAAKKEHLGFGFREDGTPKGSGFLGVMPTPAPGVFASEKSMSVNLDGKETLIPTLVPTLTRPEVDYLLGGGSPTPEIMAKAVDHAKDRMAMGLSPFYQEGERRVQLLKPSHLPPPVIAPDTRKGIQPRPKPGQNVPIPGGTTAVQNPKAEQDWPELLGTSAMAGFGTLATGVMGAAAAQRETTGKSAREIDELAQTITDYWTPGVGQNTAKYYASAILQSITGSYPSMMLGPGALPAFAVTSGGNKYLEMRRAGKDIITSLLVSIPVGLSEALTEKLPLDAFRKVADPIIKRVAKAAGLEIPGEIINTLVENALDQMSGMREKMTFKEYMSDLVDTVVTTTGQSLLMFGAGGLGAKIERKRSERKAAKEEAAKPKAEKAVEPEMEPVIPEDVQRDLDALIEKTTPKGEVQEPAKFEDLVREAEEKTSKIDEMAKRVQEAKPTKFEDLAAEAERIAKERAVVQQEAPKPVEEEKPTQPPAIREEVSKEVPPVADEMVETTGEVIPGNALDFRSRRGLGGDLSGMTHEEAVKKSKDEVDSASAYQDKIADEAPVGTRIEHPLGQEGGISWVKRKDGFWYQDIKDQVTSAQERPGGPVILKGWKVIRPTDETAKAPEAQAKTEAGGQAKQAKIEPPKVEGLRYGGIQSLKEVDPEAPDQFVFTDMETKDTFYTPVDITEEGLIKERERVRAKFKGKDLTQAPAQGNIEEVSRKQGGLDERKNLQVRKSNEEAWVGLLPGLPRGVYEKLAQNSPDDLGAEEKIQVQSLRERIRSSGEAPQEAMRSLWGPELSKAPRGLREALGSELALPPVPQVPSRQQPSGEISRGTSPAEAPEINYGDRVVYKGRPNWMVESVDQDTGKALIYKVDAENHAVKGVPIEEVDLTSLQKEGAVEEPTKAEAAPTEPEIKLTHETSGLYKGGYRATVVGGPHDGVVGFGMTPGQARSEVKKAVQGRTTFENIPAEEAEAKAETKPAEAVQPPEAKAREGVQPVQGGMVKGPFQVDDKLVMRSPHTEEDTIVNYRGRPEPGKAMVWTGISQITVPEEWLSLQEEPKEEAPKGLEARKQEIKKAAIQPEVVNEEQTGRWQIRPTDTGWGVFDTEHGDTQAADYKSRVSAENFVKGLEKVGEKHRITTEEVIEIHIDTPARKAVMDDIAPSESPLHIPKFNVGDTVSYSIDQAKDMLDGTEGYEGDPRFPELKKEVDRIRDQLQEALGVRPSKGYRRVPDETKDTIDDRLKDALHHFAESEGRWEARKEKGLTDEELKEAIAQEFGISGGSAGPTMIPIHFQGGKSPKFWFNTYGQEGKPLEGKALINKVREIMDISQPEGKATEDAPPPKGLEARKAEIEAKKAKKPSEMSLVEMEDAGVEPWQVTKKRWVEVQREERRRLGQLEESGPKAAPFSDYEEFHKREVQKAIDEGKPVPEEVRAEVEKKPEERPLPTKAIQNSLASMLRSIDIIKEIKGVGLKAKRSAESAYQSLKVHGPKVGIEIPSVGTYYSLAEYQHMAGIVQVEIGKKYGSHPTEEMREKREAAGPAPEEAPIPWSDEDSFELGLEHGKIGQTYFPPKGGNVDEYARGYTEGRAEAKAEKEKPANPLEGLRRKLERNGAGSIGEVDYKILLRDDERSYYYTRTENGIRITKGPAGLSTWSRDKTIQEAMEEARFDVTGKAEPGTEKGEWKPIGDNLQIGNVVRHAPTGKELGHIKSVSTGMSGKTVAVSKGGSYAPNVLEWNGENVKAEVGPDLTVTGGAHEVPGHPERKYVVHKRKPSLGDNRTFRVVMYQQEGGYLTEDGIGATAEEAYTNALTNLDQKLEERAKGNKPVEVAESREPVTIGDITVKPVTRWRVKTPTGEYRSFTYENDARESARRSGGEVVSDQIWSVGRMIDGAWNGRQVMTKQEAIDQANKWNKSEPIPGLKEVAISRGAAADQFSPGDKVRYEGKDYVVGKPNRDGDNLRIVSDPPPVGGDPVTRMVDARKVERRKEGEPAPAPATGNRWVKNSEGKIELYFDKDSFDNLKGTTLREEIRRRFNWSPRRKAWVSKASKDLYWPNQIIAKLEKEGVFKKAEAEKPKGLEEVKAEKKVPVEETPGYNTDWDRVMQIKDMVEGTPKTTLSSALQMAERDDFVGATRQLEQAHQQLMMTYPELADALRDTIDKGQQPTPEIETTEQALPQSKEAKKYIDSIVNPNRKDYAKSYDLYLRSGSPEGWDFPRNLSLMAQQGIRMELSKFYGEGVESPVAKEEPAPIDQELAGMTDEDVKAMLDESFEKPKAAPPAKGLEESKTDTRDIREGDRVEFDGEKWDVGFRQGDKLRLQKSGEAGARQTHAFVGEVRLVKGLGAAERPLANIMKEVGSQGVTGVSEAMKGLYELFGGSKLKSFPAGFDQETYAKAKPHFEASFEAFRKAGRGLKEFFTTIRDQFGDQIRPYLQQFILEYKAKKPLDITEKEAQTGVEGGQDVDQAGERPANTAEVEGNRSGAGREGTENIQAPETKWTTDDLRQGDGPESTGQLRGGGDRGPSAFTPTADVLGESSEPNQSPEQVVGGSPVNVAGVQRPAKGRDFRITPEFVVREGSWKNQAKVNLDIIDLVKKLDQEKRPATPEEQALLAKYTGWGASELANNMFPAYVEHREVRPNWAHSGWQDLVERLVGAMTTDEIKIAANSTQFAHYTSFPVIRSIYRALEKFGFAGGKILEPGMGVGNFYGLLPETMRKGTTYTGIEYDPITAKIAQYLYPRQNILLDDFTKKNLPNNFFDVAIGNPPFARTKILVDPDYKKFRFNLHEFFFAKSLDKVRPGGVLTFVTSRYAMDKVKDRTREYLMGKADLIGAIRLPQTAFKENAGTDVVTDVLFFRKKIPGEETVGQNWKELKEIQTPEGPFLINEYYIDHPEMVLGSHSGQGTMQNRPDAQYTVIPEKGTNIEEEFAKAVEKLPSNVFSSAKQPAEVKHAAVVERDFNPAIKKEGGLYVSDKGDIMIVESGSGVPLDSIQKVSSTDKEFYKGYISLRDAVKRAHYDQLNEGPWEESLTALQKEYKAFTKKHGRVTQYTSYMTKEADEDGSETSVERRRYKYWGLYRIDTEFPLVTSLEVINDAGDILDGPPLTGRVLKKPPVPEIKTVPDALAVSLDQTGHLDLEDIARVAQVPMEQAIEQLGDLIYLDPSKGTYVLSDEYLSGDVVKKLGEAKTAADLDPQYKKNVEALQKVQPLPLTATEITVNLGAPWVPEEYVTQFAQDVLGFPDSTVVNYNPEDNSWTYSEVVDSSSYFRRRRGGRQPLKRQGMRGSTSEWSTEDRGANEILDAVLNNKTIRVMTPDPGPPRRLVFDEPGTAAVNDVAKRMRDGFKSWVWEEADRAKELVDLWNTTKNNIAKRKFDGSHLTLPGVTLSWLWHPHQKDGIWRVIQDGNVYLAHAVGSGKTAEYIAAGMEMKRLGLISKPMYSVPKSVLQQFANEFQELYPMANIMVADEDNFHTDNRRKFIAQATLNNPDAVVIPHSALTLLKMKEENIAPIRDELIADLRDSLEDMRGSGANRFRIKQMEARIDALIQRFDSMIQKGDNVVTFEDMGVDFLFYDEAHAARKLDFATNRNDKGIDSVGSARAMDLYIKTKFLERQKPKRSHVFGSGTPVVNTIGELYSIMKFFDEDQMEKDGIRHFDAWASTFGEVVAKPEMNSAGQYEMVSRFSNFVNVHELMTRVKLFMDTLSVSQLRGLLAESGRGVPEIQGNKPEIRITPPSTTMKAYQNEVLAPRIEASKRWKPSPGQRGNPDPMINIITDGRLASIDMRFHMKVPNDPNSKLNQWIDGIIDGYKATKDFTYLDEEGKPSDVKGGTLIAFFNLGFGKEVANKRGFDSRAWVNSRLKEAGIPLNEVIWFEDYSADSKINAKKAVIRDFRNGVRRILIGSAKTMGVGLNAQRRLAESHYLDPPWFPADVEQPDGRILRQGNQNKEVKIVRYATKGSYDSTQWGMVARKSGAIEKAFTGENIRRLEDISETSQFEMASALASGDERAIRLAALRGEVENLRNLQIAHNSQQRSMETEKQHWEWAVRSSTSWKEKLEKAKEMVPEYVSAIKGKIGDKEYDNREEFGLALRDAYKVMLARMDEAIAGSKELTGKADNVSLKEKMASISGETGPEIPLHFYGVPNHHFLSLNFTPDVHYDIEEGVLWAVNDNFSGKGMVQKIVGKMNGFDHEIDAQERNVREAETELKKIKARLGAPFPYAEELLSNTTELYTLEHELIAEGQAQQAVTAQQYDEAEQELIRRIEGEHGAGVRKEGSNYVHERGGRKYTIPAEEVAGHKRNIAEEAKRATATEEPEEEGGGLGEEGKVDLSAAVETWRKGKEGRESLYQKIFNRFASIENLVEKARKLGAVIPAGLDAAKRAREYLGLGGKVQSVLENKTFRIKDDGTIELTGEGLKPILDDYFKSSSEKDMDQAQLDLNAYMIATRTIEDLQRPKSPWNDDEIATQKQVKDAKDTLNELTRKYGNLDHFEDIAPRYYDFQARVLHLLVEAGNMSEKKYRQIIKANPHYVPFQRVMDEIEPEPDTGERVPKAKRPFTEARSPVKRIKGSELDIHDIIESTIQNTFRIMDASERNIVARSIANLKDLPDLGIEEVEPPYVPVANITHTAMIDKGFRDKLQKFAESLGATFTTGKEVKPGTRTLGTFTPGINEVKHRQATGEDVFSHEAGHFFDEKFGLKPKFYKRGASKEVAQELIDFMQKQGQSKNRMKKAEERFAHGFEWWLTQRALAEKDIPKFSKAMENIIKEIPALKPLLDIRPTTEAGRESQQETIFRKSKFTPPGRTIKYWEGGEEKYITVPKNLYAAMTGLNEVSAGLWVKLLSAPAHWLRTGATITPEFAARNLLRDQFTAFMQTRIGFRPLIDSSGAVADILGKSEVYYDWLRSGAAYSTINELNRKNLEKMVKDLVDRKSPLRHLNVITKAQDLSQLLEMATRIGIYKAGIRKGLTPVEAGFESREGTVDFARRGSSLTDWNRMTAFFNAGLQGFDKTVRTAYNHPLETAAYGFATIAIPSILLFLASKDDPEYKEIPRWQKDLFWILPIKVKGAYVRIPKPFIYGQIFGSAVERFLEYAYTKDKKAFHDFHKTLLDAALPTQGDPESGLIVTGVKPLIENLGPQGYSFFRQTPIVPEGKKGLLPFMQHGKYTSETAKAAGKALGYSPAKLENLVQGYFGGTGRYALQAGDLAMRLMQEAQGKKPVPTRPKELADYPLVKGFVTRPPVSQPESLDYFYEQAQDLKRAYDSYQAAIKNIKGGEGKYILEKNPKLFLSPSIEEAKKSIGDIDKNIDMIIKTSMPELQKRAAIEKAERVRLKLAQSVNAFVEKAKGVRPQAETRAQ